MNIQLFLNNEEETPIISKFDMSSNPFKLGDVIKLSVDEIRPVELNKYNEQFAEKLVEQNKQNRKLFHLRDIKLVRENKYIEIENGKIIIEYHCEIIK
jgi:hypothetical protein